MGGDGDGEAGARPYNPTLLRRILPENSIIAFSPRPFADKVKLQIKSPIDVGLVYVGFSWQLA